MASTAVSIVDQINEGKSLAITDSELRYQTLIRLNSDSALILNLSSIFTKYKPQLKKLIGKYKFNAKDALIYQYKPWALSYDLYNTIELAPFLLQINGMISCSDFYNLEEGIYLFRGAIIDFINEILIKEEKSLRANRNTIRKELATSD